MIKYKCNIVPDRSSRPDMFCKKGVLKNFAKFTAIHLCQSLFFNKVADLRPTTLLKKRLWHRCFPVNFVKFLRTPFFNGTPLCCFWTEKLILSTHFLAIYILSLLFWVIILGHSDFGILNLESFYFLGRLIEIYACTSITVKEMLVCTLPIGRLYLGRRMAFGSFAVTVLKLKAIVTLGYKVMMALSKYFDYHHYELFSCTRFRSNIFERDWSRCLT